MYRSRTCGTSMPCHALLTQLCTHMRPAQRTCGDEPGSAANERDRVVQPSASASSRRATRALLSGLRESDSADTCPRLCEEPSRPYVRRRSSMPSAARSARWCQGGADVWLRCIRIAELTVSANAQALVQAEAHRLGHFSLGTNTTASRGAPARPSREESEPATLLAIAPESCPPHRRGAAPRDCRV